MARTVIRAGAGLRIRLDRKKLISVMFLTRGEGKQGRDYFCFAGTTYYFRSSRSGKGRLCPLSFVINASPVGALIGVRNQT